MLCCELTIRLFLLIQTIVFFSFRFDDFELPFVYTGFPTFYRLSIIQMYFSLLARYLQTSLSDIPCLINTTLVLAWSINILMYSYSNTVENVNKIDRKKHNGEYWAVFTLSHHAREIFVNNRFIQYHRLIGQLPTRLLSEPWVCFC